MDIWKYSNKSVSVSIVATSYTLHSKHCSKETGTKPRQDQSRERSPSFWPSLGFLLQYRALFYPTVNMSNRRLVAEKPVREGQERCCKA
jgi:hypothetical protein